MKVVYVMGTDRSGSTVLDLVLGNHAGVFGAGELTSLVRHGWDGAPCACGAERRACPFWSEVAERFRASGGDLATLGPRERFLDRLRRVPWLTSKDAPASERFRAWAQDSLALLSAIRETSGARVLVDSSKHPARALALLRTGALEVFLVHLIRDARGYAWSVAKSFAADRAGGVERNLPARSLLRAALDWNVIHRAADRVAREVPTDRLLRVRYEDYVTDPVRALAPLLAFLGAREDEVLERLAGGTTLSTGHLVAGNRLRTSMEVTLRPDTRWRTEMPDSSQRRAWLLTRGRMRRYGYERSPA